MSNLRISAIGILASLFTAAMLGYGAGTTVAGSSNTPEILQLKAETCPTGIKTEYGANVTSGITDITSIPGGLALAGEFVCGMGDGIYELKYLALWDGETVTFPADQPSSAPYAIEYFK